MTESEMTQIKDLIEIKLLCTVPQGTTQISTTWNVTGKHEKPEIYI